MEKEKLTIYLSFIINSFILQMKDSFTKQKVSEYDQEIPQLQTADNPVAPQRRAAQPSRDTRKTN